ncbi:unnamed protein product [Citrullus colocynthis]|uniref:Secreted protein n=1 Tax=Citrullus colocynthis TaxID=252529 RepID=A0ABP0XTN2_9ROSI
MAFVGLLYMWLCCFSTNARLPSNVECWIFVQATHQLQQHHRGISDNRFWSSIPPRSILSSSAAQAFQPPHAAVCSIGRRLLHATGCHTTRCHALECRRLLLQPPLSPVFAAVRCSASFLALLGLLLSLVVAICVLEEFKVAVRRRIDLERRFCLPSSLAALRFKFPLSAVRRIESGTIDLVLSNSTAVLKLGIDAS